MRSMTRPLYREPAADRVRFARQFVGKLVDVDETPNRDDWVITHRGVRLLSVAGCNTNTSDVIVLRVLDDELKPGHVWTMGPVDKALSLATVARIAEAGR